MYDLTGASTVSFSVFSTTALTGLSNNCYCAQVFVAEGLDIQNTKYSFSSGVGKWHMYTITGHVTAMDKTEAAGDSCSSNSCYENVGNYLAMMNQLNRLSSRLLHADCVSCNKQQQRFKLF